MSEWHAQRAGMLSASNFAAAMGISPHCSRQCLWRILRGLEAPFEGNAATEWGSRHEAEAIAAYEVATGALVIPAQQVIHREHKWICGTPDGYVDDGIIEVKCPFNLKVHDSVPAHYMAQVQAYMELTDRNWCHFISWTPEKFNKILVERDGSIWSSMFELVSEFWECVQSGADPGRMKDKESVLSLFEKDKA